MKLGIGPYARRGELYDRRRHNADETLLSFDLCNYANCMEIQYFPGWKILNYVKSMAVTALVRYISQLDPGLISIFS